MGVNGVVIDPRALPVLQTLLAQLANRNHRIAGFARHPVAVNVELGVERVVLLVLLTLLEGRRDEVRIQQADRGRRLGIIHELARLGSGLGVVGGGLHIAQAVSTQSGLDVAVDVLGLLALGVGIHDELLNDHRVGDTHDQRRDDHDGHTRDRQPPRTCARRGDEQHRHRNADGGQDRLSRNGGVDIGVTGAVELRIRGVQRGVAAEPVARTVKHGEQGEENGQVKTRGPREVGLAGHRDSAVQVVDDDTGDAGDHDHAR